jgi:orotate phosphoribosyltransferase
MTEKEVLDLFDKHGALLTGHFKLSSGLHSEKYLQCALVLQHPGTAGKLAKALAKKFSGKIDAVIGPALGGITLAYEVARALKVRGLFTERHPSTSSGCLPEPVEGRHDGPPASMSIAGSRAGKMLLRRGFSIKKGERILIVEDVVTTGGSTKEVIEVVRSLGGKVAGVGSIIDRSESAPAFGAPFYSLAKIKIVSYKEGECPLCKKGIPLTKPGSRGS